MSLGMEVCLSLGDLVLAGEPLPPSSEKGAEPPPCFGPYLLWPDGWMDQHATSYGGRPRPKRHCVRWGPSFLPKGHSPQFLAHVSCGQTAGWIKMPLGMEVDLCSGDIVLDGTELPPKRGRAPQFSAHVYCGQTAGCISIPFGTEVGLGPGDIVLDGDPAAPKKGHSPPIFSPCLLWPNCWMDQDATWYGSRPRPRQLSVG